MILPVLPVPPVIAGDSMGVLCFMGEFLLLLILSTGVSVSPPSNLPVLPVPPVIAGDSMGVLCFMGEFLLLLILSTGVSASPPPGEIIPSSNPYNKVTGSLCFCLSMCTEGSCLPLNLYGSPLLGSFS